jgi:hypothetical protein
MRQRPIQCHGRRGARQVAWGAAALLLATQLPAQVSQQSPTLDALHASAPSVIEGVWLPSMGGPPPGTAKAQSSAAARIAPASLGAAASADAPPPEIGGLGEAEVPGGPPAPPGRAPAVTGSTLECAPVQRLGGAGGGMSNLWIQGRHEIVMISEEDMDVARKIYLNAQHPAKLRPQPNGHSIGHWEADVLVVDSIGFSDARGADSGEHVVERIHRDGKALLDEVTVSQRDGSVSTRNIRTLWRPDLHVYENVCEEGFDRYVIVNGQLDNPNVPPDRK